MWKRKLYLYVNSYASVTQALPAGTDAVLLEAPKISVPSQSLFQWNISLSSTRDYQCHLHQTETISYIWTSKFYLLNFSLTFNYDEENAFSQQIINWVHFILLLFHLSKHQMLCYETSILTSVLHYKVMNNNSRTWY